MQHFFPILVLTTIGSIAGLAGGILLLTQTNLARKLSAFSIPFAAGVLLAVSFLDLLPEAIEVGEAHSIFIIVLITIVVSFFIEQFLVQLHHHDKDGSSVNSQRAGVKDSVPLLVVGDSIHNFMDGVVIAAAYITNPSLGIIIAIATFLHELPHEIGDFGIMLSVGWKKKKILLINLFSAASAYLGAAGAIILGDKTEEFIGVILAVAAGIFIYIALSDLLPEIEKRGVNNRRFQSSLLLAAGILAMWIVGTVLPH